MIQKYHGSAVYAAHVMAAEERHRKDIQLAETYHLVRQNKSARGGSISLAATARVALGAWLIRTGERLHGAAPRPADMLPVLGQ